LEAILFSLDGLSLAVFLPTSTFFIPDRYTRPIPGTASMPAFTTQPSQEDLDTMDDIRLEKNDSASHHLLSDRMLESRGSEDRSSEGTMVDQASSSRRVRSFWRRNVQWISVMTLQLLILLALVFPPAYRDSRRTKDITEGVETGGDINGLYRTSESAPRSQEPEVMPCRQTYDWIADGHAHATVSHKYEYLMPQVEVYMPNMTSDDDRLEVRKKWDMLMPSESSVVLPSPRGFRLRRVPKGG
jgi:hypothetical protein